MEINIIAASIAGVLYLALSYKLVSYVSRLVVAQYRYLTFLKELALGVFVYLVSLVMLFSGLVGVLYLL